MLASFIFYFIIIINFYSGDAPKNEVFTLMHNSSVPADMHIKRSLGILKNFQEIMNIYVHTSVLAHLFIILQ